MAASVQHGSLPFKEQIAFFRQKLNMPTATWTDIFDGQHSRAFVVAGAMRDDLLADLRAAVDKAILEGGTLQQFRKDFDEIVKRYGWAYQGGRNWRTRVIYETNLNTSYMTGRYEQMKAVSRTRPFWRYKHDDRVEHPRLHHLAWDGLVLRHDDPFWAMHFPPNGWGCKCRVETLSARDLKRLGKDGPDAAPEIEMETRVVGANGPNPRTVQVPKGVDPGFGYNVGEANSGRRLADDVMDNWRKQGADAWENLTPKTWQEFGRPDRIPLDAPKAKPVAPAKSTQEIAEQLRELLGGDEKVFDVKGVPIAVNADSLAQHLAALGRSSYLPLLEEALTDPFEVWYSFERHKGTDYVSLRARVIKAFALDHDRGFLVVANAVRGRLEAWTVIPTTDLAYVQRNRRGMLVYGRE